MSLNQKEDFNGKIAKIIKLAEDKSLSTNQMIHIISKGDKGIEKYFAIKKEKIIKDHKSMLDEFQI